MRTESFLAGIADLMNYTSKACEDNEDEGNVTVDKWGHDEANNEWGAVLKKVAQTSASSVVLAHNSFILEHDSVLKVTLADDFVHINVSSHVASTHDLFFVAKGIEVEPGNSSTVEPAAEVQPAGLLASKHIKSFDLVLVLIVVTNPVHNTSDTNAKNRENCTKKRKGFSKSFHEALACLGHDVEAGNGINLLFSHIKFNYNYNLIRLCNFYR